MRREWAIVHGGAEIRGNAVWRGRIVEWVRKQQARGKVVPEFAARLGIRVCLMVCRSVATRCGCGRV